MLLRKKVFFKYKKRFYKKQVDKGYPYVIIYVRCELKSYKTLQN